MQSEFNSKIYSRDWSFYIWEQKANKHNDLWKEHYSESKTEQNIEKLGLDDTILLSLVEMISDWILRGVVGQVQEKADVVHGAILLKIRLEEAGSFHVDLRDKWYKYKYWGTLGERSWTILTKN